MIGLSKTPPHSDRSNMKKVLLAPKNGMRPVHPGEVLREDYLKPLKMSANALATALKVHASRINDIVLERRGITVDTAMRIVRYFGGDVQSWMNLQTAYEIKIAEKLLEKKCLLMSSRWRRDALSDVVSPYMCFSRRVAGTSEICSSAHT